MFVYGFLTLIILSLMVLISTRLIPKLKKTNYNGQDPSDIKLLIEALEKSETKLNPKPGTEKRIFLQPHHYKKGPLSFVFLHGFSATRHEVSPVFESIAKDFDAPIFMTRFTGHGLGADDLGAAKVKDWIQDALEALHIGQSLGNEVILTCMSTGCALGLYLAYFFPDKIKALVMICPNFSPADPRSFLAGGPLGKWMTRLILGPYYEIKASSAEQFYYWTCRYGTSAISEMVNLVKAAKNLPLEEIKLPILTIYTPFDKVVSVTEIEKNIVRLPSPKNRIISLVETQQHLIAGDIMNPKMNDSVIKEIANFLKSL